MKRKLFAVMLAAALMGSTLSYGQEPAPKTDKKENKMMKKASKGKGHKMMKKAVKADKKDNKG